MVKVSIAIFSSLLLTLSTMTSQSQPLICEPVLPEKTLNKIAKRLCETQWREIEIASNNLNANGTREDRALERFNSILNSIENNDGRLSSKLAAELIEILEQKTQLRVSIQKNLLVTRFEEQALDTWCRWRNDKTVQGWSRAHLRDIQKIEEFMSCGIER